MPKKPRNMKGRHPKPLKTNRKEIPDGVRQVIMNLFRTSANEVLQWPLYDLLPNTIRKIR
jgi:hypothetical protein